MKNSQRGSTMVETTLVLLLCMAVIIGIMEFGRALYTYHAVSNAARLGTRYAIVHGAGCLGGCTATSTSIQNYVRGQTLAVTASNLTVSTTWTGTALDGSACSSSSQKQGCTVAVTVSYPFNFLLPYITGPLTMSSTSTMVISN